MFVQVVEVLCHSVGTECTAYTATGAEQWLCICVPVRRAMYSANSCCKRVLMYTDPISSSTFNRSHWDRGVSFIFPYRTGTSDGLS